MLIQLWIHESARVYSDRFIVTTETTRFRDLIRDVCKRQFEEFNLKELLSGISSEEKQSEEKQSDEDTNELLFTNFMTNTVSDGSVYLPSRDIDNIRVKFFISMKTLFFFPFLIAK